MRIRMLLYIGVTALLLFPWQASGQVPTGLEEKGRGTVKYLNIIKVYDAALYATPTADRDNILSAEHSRCLVLTYALSVDAKDMVRAAEQVLSNQHDREKIEALRSEIDRLHRNYQDVAKGDRYSLCYDSASRTTELALNDQALTRITSPAFAQLYFGIWLGSKAIDTSLQKHLLAELKESS